MPRIELPPNLSPEEERAVIAALERVLAAGRERPSPWVMAGRAQALGMGFLQVRRDAEHPWALRGPVPFARAGTPPLLGRGDAK
jgi:hypothetical protein